MIRLTQHPKENGRWRVVRRLDPASLKLFIAVIEEGTIAAAAEREHIVAAAVSRRVSKLESILKTQLIVRTNRGLEPTAAGIALANLARVVLLDLDELYAQIHEYAAGVRGHVRLCATIAAITDSLPNEIQSFLIEHPQVRVYLEEKASTAVAKAVAEHAAHIGIFTTGALHGQNLETFPYRSYELVVIAPNEHVLAGRTSITFGETLDFDYVGLRVDSTITLQLLKAASMLNRTIKLRTEVSAYDAVCHLVERGLGLSILPRGAAQPHVEARRIRAITLEENWARQDLRICVRAFDTLPIAAKQLVEHLKRTS